MDNENVKAKIPSDPYLIGFYDERKLSLSHNASEQIQFKIEVNPIGHGPWITYMEISVQTDEIFSHEFPSDFEARWVRIIANKDCEATALFEYK